MVNQARYKNNRSIQFSFGVVMLSCKVAARESNGTSFHPLLPISVDCGKQTLTVVFSIAGYPRNGGNSQIGETSLFSHTTADCAKSTDYSSKDNPRILLADFGG
ncbi:hypothetical protein TNCV_2562411 [Trichonephila clavipes]|nr:hypothetical protein TNCV_2562411 [Trichonephila clavipes]